MNGTRRVRMAVQRSGRLAERTQALLDSCGLDIEWRSRELVCASPTLPLDVMLVRDDDIPRYVRDGTCELGIVGLNVLEESDSDGRVTVMQRLGFGACRLSLAVPKAAGYDGIASLQGLRIASAYPYLLRRFLRARGIDAEIVEMHGSVEIAPALQIADAICDLVSSGSTLVSNGLREVECVLASEGVLVRGAREESPEKEIIIQRIAQRTLGVTKAAGAKYVMMNAPRTALAAIYAIMPGMESPSVIPLGVDGRRVAIHAVAREPDFWATIERLKEVGATSILVAPIEKIID